MFVRLLGSFLSNVTTTLYKGDNMQQKTYAKHGKCLFYFSIVASLVVIYFTYFTGDFIENLSSSNFIATLVFCVANVLLIISGLKMREKYPEYYKYQVKSASVLLMTAIVFDIIPRIIFIS